MHDGTIKEETLREKFDRGAELIVDEDIVLSDEPSHRMANDICSSRENPDDLESIIWEPWNSRFYAFYLEGGTITKFGHTMRPVNVRINEWKNPRTGFPDLVWNPSLVWSGVLPNNPDKFIKDHPVHALIEADGIHRFTPDELHAKGLTGTTNEAFEANFSKEVLDGYVKMALELAEEGKVSVYSKFSQHKETTKEYLRSHRSSEDFSPRDMQQKVIEACKKAYANGRRKLLLAAAPRFGKTSTALWCVKALGFDLTVVTCGYVNAKNEWMEAVLAHRDFARYEFFDADDFKNAPGIDIVQKALDENKKVVVFLTLPDIQGEEVKDHHRIFFDNHANDVDALIVDETHYGARAEAFSAKLGDTETITEAELFDLVNEEINDSLRKLKLYPKLRMDVSGTPYNILASGEYTEEDIICKVRFADMYQAMLDWFAEHPDEDEANNPYLGIPQILNFGFCTSKSDSAILREMKDKGLGTLLDLFAYSPDASNHNLMYPELVKKFFKAFLGFEKDSGILSLLDDPKVQDAKLGNHQVWAFNYKLVCDGVTQILKEIFEENGVADQYDIIGISSKKHAEPTADDVKRLIAVAEKNGKKTISLTVDRMLTASSVPEWSLMLYAKRGQSAQAYDQARLRLGTPWVVKYKDEDGNVSRKVEKQQAVFIDLDPVRMLCIQVEIAHHAARDNRTLDNDENFKDVLEREYGLLPTYLANNMDGHFHRVSFENAMSIASSNLFKERNDIGHLINSIGIDYSLMDDAAFIEQIEQTYKGKNKQSFVYEATKMESDEEVEDLGLEDAMDEGDLGEGADGSSSGVPGDPSDAEEQISKTEGNLALFKDKVLGYYQALATLAFCCSNRIGTLGEFIEYYGKPEHRGDLDAFNIDYDVLTTFSETVSPHVIEDFDFVISNASTIRHGDMSVAEKKKQLFGHIANFGINEVPTALEVVEKVFDDIEREDLDRLLKARKRVLEIGSQTGEFTDYLIDYMEENGYGKEDIEATLAVIPSSRAAGVLVRTLLEMRGYSSDNVASFGMDDLYASIEGAGFDYTSTSRKLCQPGKKMGQIGLDDVVGEDSEMVKFGAVVGNPPYQQETGGAGRQSKPIYPHFVNLSEAIASHVCLIIPSRWFSGGMGLDEFRNKMMCDKHMVSIVDYVNAKECFPDLSIGGVCYFYWNEEQETEKCKITNILNGKANTSERPLDEFPVVIRYNQAVSILHKVQEKKESTVDGLISPMSPFGLSTKVRGTQDKTNKTDLRVLSSKGFGYIPKSDVQGKNPKLMSSHKVAISRCSAEHAGEPDKNGQFRVLTRSMQVLCPNDVCTHSYVLMGPASTEDEAQNMMRYLKTPFARFFVLLALSSININQLAFKLVPVQDFGSDSDISWTDDIDDLNKQLCDKYGLSEEDRKFIKSLIKDF